MNSSHSPCSSTQYLQKRKKQNISIRSPSKHRFKTIGGKKKQKETYSFIPLLWILPHCIKSLNQWEFSVPFQVSYQKRDTFKQWITGGANNTTHLVLSLDLPLISSITSNVLKKCFLSVWTSYELLFSIVLKIT